MTHTHGVRMEPGGLDFTLARTAGNLPSDLSADRRGRRCFVDRVSSNAKWVAIPSASSTGHTFLNGLS